MMDDSGKFVPVQVWPPWEVVAQLHGVLKMNEKLCPAYGGLRQIAHHAGVRFFSEVVELPEDELDSSLEAIHERAQPNTSLLEATVNCHLKPEPWNHS